MPEWAYWTSGGVLATVGVIALLLALFADRARGRPRCRRCGYSMQGAASLTCPECGRTAPNNRDLLRPRRHRRWATAASLLLIAGAGLLLHANTIDRRGGWWFYAPRPLLIALVDTPLSAVARMGLDARVPVQEAYSASNIISVIDAPATLKDALSEAQWRRLSAQCADILLKSAPDETRPECWAAELLLPRRTQGALPWAVDMLGRVVPHDAPADEALADALARAEPGRARNPLSAIGNRWRHKVWHGWTERDEPAWMVETVRLACGERPEMTVADRADAAAVVLLGWRSEPAHFQRLFGDGSEAALPEPVWRSIQHAARRPDPYRASDLLHALRQVRERLTAEAAGEARLREFDHLLFELDAIVRLNLIHGGTAWQSALAIKLDDFYNADVPIAERIAWLGELTEDETLFTRNTYSRKQLETLAAELERALREKAE